MTGKIAELREIGRILGLHTKEEITTAEVLELLCQIALALLIIFVMAYVLFMARAKAEVEAAKAMYGVLQGKYDQLTRTEKGELYCKLERALMELQRQKLLLALEQIEDIERQNVGLKRFRQENSDGKIQYLMDDIISEGQIIDERFRRACIVAKQILPNPKEMRRGWLSRIAMMKGMSLKSSAFVESIIDHPEIISKDNARWLFEEIDNRIKAIHVDCCDMQAKAVAYLVDYCKEHPDVLEGSELGKQLDDALSARPEDRIRLISEFNRELFRSVKSLFDNQNVPLLAEI